MSSTESSIPLMLRRYDFADHNKLRYLRLYGSSLLKGDTRKMTRWLPDYMRRIETVQDGIAYVRTSYHESSNRLCAEAGGSMQGMDKLVRNALLPEGAVDIDMQSASTVVLAGVCRLHEITCPRLDDFNAHYDTYMREVRDVLGDEAKAFKNKVVFGCGSEVIDDRVGEWAARLKRECHVLAESLYEHYPDIYQQAVRSDEEKAAERASKRRKVDREYTSNVAGIFLSLLYFKKETEVYRVIETAGQQQGWWHDRIVPMFDGMIVLPSGDIDLRLLERAVLSETGLSVVLKFKPLEPAMQLDTTTIPDHIVVRDMHEEASEHLLMAMRGKAYKQSGSQGVTTWMRFGRVWIDDKEVIQNEMMRICSAMSIKHLKVAKDGEESEEPFSSDMRHCEKIVKLTKTKLESVPCFSRQLVLGSQMKICFADGYYEFTPDRTPTGTYHRGGIFDTGVCIPRDFPPRIQEDIDFVMQNIILPPFENSPEGTLDRFLRALGRSMAGHTDKMTYILTGFRDCSKSVLMQFIRNAFHGYVGSLASMTFIMRAGADPHLDNRYAFQIEHSRIGVLSELTQDQRLSGDKIKAFQSLKEGILSRKNWHEPRDVYSLATGFFCLNDIPEISPADAMQRVMIFHMNNRFVPQHELDRWKAAHPYDNTYKLADERVEQWIRDDRYTGALIHIILEAYRPDPVMPTEEMLDSVEELMQEAGEALYDRLFEITLDPEDKIYVGEVSAVMKREHLSIGINKAKRELQQIIENRCKAEGKQVFKVAGRDGGHIKPRRHFFCGVRQRKEEDNGMAAGFFA